MKIYVNSPPIISQHPPSITYLSLNEKFQYKLGSYDANENATLFWYLEDGPETMWLDSIGNISWQSKDLDFVNYSIQLTDNYKTAKFSGLIYTNAQPMITSSPPNSINLGDTLKYTVEAEDLNTKSPFDNNLENIIEYILLEQVNDAQFINNIFIWTPNKKNIGNQKITLGVTDGISKAIQDIIIRVNDVPKFISSDSVSIEIDKQLIHILKAEDLNILEKLQFSIKDTTLGIELKNDTLGWVPRKDQLGKHSININLTDGHLNSQMNQQLKIYVYLKPKFNNTAKTEAFVGVEYIFVPSVDFMNKNSALNKINFISGTATKMFWEDNQLKWIPTKEDIGIHQMTFQAIDNTGIKSESMTYTVRVKDNPFKNEKSNQDSSSKENDPKQNLKKANPDSQEDETLNEE